MSTRKPYIYVKKTNAPIQLPDAIHDDQWLARNEVYVTAGLLWLVLATDIRLTMPATIIARYPADESPAPPRPSTRLTAELWDEIQAKVGKAIAEAPSDAVERNRAIERLHALTEFLCGRGLPSADARLE